MFGVDAVLRVPDVLIYTINFEVWFRQVACAIGCVTHSAWFDRRFIGDNVAAEQSLFATSERGRAQIVVKLTTICWF